ncbi:MAG: hybrid sensor histidine kinase/response regulator [Deltaproteobacteria bacterium]|nr:hybrid sensor histidine kinase/response regulator [Deltaproteobacteria bacterium]
MLDKPLVVIADLDPAPRDLLRLAAEVHGVEVRTVDTGAALLDAIEGAASSLTVVIAAPMPSCSIEEVMSHLQARAPQAQLVLACSADEASASLQCVRAGALLLRKPLMAVEVESLLAAVLERARLRRQQQQSEALKTMLGCADPAQLAGTLVMAFKAALDAQGAGLHLPGAGQTGLQSSTADGALEREELVEEWLRSRVALDRAPAILDLLDVRERDAEWPRRAAQGQALLIPLVSGDRLVGVLSAERHTRPFTSADLALAAPLAAQARLALDNQQLFGHLVASDRLAALGNLAASVAHEVRSPLTYAMENAHFILQNLEAARRHAPELAPAQAERLQTDMNDAARDTVDALQRIRDLVRDIGALSSPDETTRVTFDLNDAVRAAVRMTKAEQLGRVRVMTRLGAELKLVGSVGRITQVFVNLLVNAMQALPQEAGHDGKVVVITRRDGDRVIAEVSDNGPGIAPGVLPRLFEPYFTTKPAGKGTGLGLFLCRDILRRHRGEIRVRSSPVYGTTFTIELPAEGAVALRSEQPDRWTADPKVEAMIKTFGN